MGWCSIVSSMPHRVACTQRLRFEGQSNTYSPITSCAWKQFCISFTGKVREYLPAGSQRSAPHVAGVAISGRMRCLIIKCEPTTMSFGSSSSHVDIHTQRLQFTPGGVARSYGGQYNRRSCLEPMHHSKASIMKAFDAENSKFSVLAISRPSNIQSRNVRAGNFLSWQSSRLASTISNASVNDSDEVLGTYALTELALDSVVKIFTMASSPNYFLPWQNKPQREITGSGFIVCGQRILTNAHVVADQTYVVVRKHGSPCKYRAEVQAVGHECDLAILKVHDDEFWEGMRTLQLGDIPHLQESVAVVGYPQGGDNISVTGGVVSRVEPTQYVHGAAHLMAIQIDAAINPGNSGGPALMEGKVVGVAFQNLAGAENIGYIIPVPVINHFLSDVEERGHYVGFCSLGLTCQTTENAQLREHLQMPPGLTGVLVNKIQPLTYTNQWVKKDDLLAAFDGTPIANDGTVHFRNRERISFDHLVSMKKAGETARLTVLRNGEISEFNVKLSPLLPLAPIHQFDQLPTYFIFAGLVFTPLTQPYLHEYGDDWYNTSPRRLCDRALTATLTKPGEQFVILSQVLMDEINAGYERLAELQVQKVNGVEVHNLRHLKELVEGCKESSLRFDLDDGRVVVLNFEDAKEASLKILQRHRIPSHASLDLLQEVVPVELNQSDLDKPLQAISEEEEEPIKREELVSVPM